MSTASAGSQGRGSLSPSPTHRLTREWPARSPVRLRPSAALPAAEFSPNAHRTLVSRGLQVFGVGVGISVRAWVQWEAVREGCVCVCVCVLGREARHRECFESRTATLRLGAKKAVLSRVASRKPVFPRAPGCAVPGRYLSQGIPQESAFCVCITLISDHLSPLRSPEISATFCEAHWEEEIPSLALALSYLRSSASKKRQQIILPSSPSFPKAAVSSAVPCCTQWPPNSNPMLPKRHSWVSGSRWPYASKGLSGVQ